MTLSWFGRRDLLRRWRTCDGLEDVRAEAGSWSANTMRPYVADRLTQQPDAEFAMMAGCRSEFVKNPPFFLLRRKTLGTGPVSSRRVPASPSC